MPMNMDTAKSIIGCISGVLSFVIFLDGIWIWPGLFFIAVAVILGWVGKPRALKIQQNIAFIGVGLATIAALLYVIPRAFLGGPLF